MQKMVGFGEGAIKLHMHEMSFSFFLSIYSRCDILASWPHDTLPCVLILHYDMTLCCTDIFYKCLISTVNVLNGSVYLPGSEFQILLQHSP